MPCSQICYCYTYGWTTLRVIFCCYESTKLLYTTNNSSKKSIDCCLNLMTYFLSEARNKEGTVYFPWLFYIQSSCWKMHIYYLIKLAFLEITLNSLNKLPIANLYSLFRSDIKGSEFKNIISICMNKIRSVSLKLILYVMVLFDDYFPISI